MSVRQMLDEVRREYMEMSVAQLFDIVNEMGLDTDAVTRESLVDELMAVEEHAAFH